MSISLNDHENRIKALESGNGSGLTITGNDNQRCLQFDNGLKIHYGRMDSKSSTRTMTFLKPYTYLPYVNGITVGSNDRIDSFVFNLCVWSVTKNNFKYRERNASDSSEYYFIWCAIGYLVSNRLRVTSSFIKEVLLCLYLLKMLDLELPF